MARQTAEHSIGNGSDNGDNGELVAVYADQVAKQGGYAEVLRVAIPLILSTASLTIMLFVSRMLLSWYGASSVAASTPGGVTFFTICSFFCGTAQYTNTLVAQHHGAGDKPACARAVWQGVFFALLSAPLFVTCIPLGNMVLAWAGHEAEVLRQEQEYFSILMLGGVALPINAALSSFFSGRGRTTVVLYGNLLGNVADAVLAYVLIFGKFGFPEMGIRGAGLAAAVTGVLPGLYWGWLFLSSRYQPTYRTRAQCRWDGKLFRMLLRFGLPAGIQFFLDVASFTLFVLLIGRMGEIDLAACNIVLSIELLSFLPMVGMSLATATLVGEYMGRGNHEVAQRCVYSALKLAMAYSFFFSFLYAAVPGVFLDLFGSDAQHGAFREIVARGVILLRIVAFYCVFNNMFILFSGALSGAGDTRFTMWTQTGISWLFFVPSVYAVISYVPGGMLAAWICLLVYVVVLGTVFLLRFRSGHWKTIKMVSHSPEPATF
jgi:multidrug resistance protein, MATE family